MSKNVKSVKAMVLEVKALIAKEEEAKNREFLNKIETTYKLYRTNRM